MGNNIDNNQLEFINLGSGSSGNAYIIKKGNECVLVECGFNFNVLTKKLMENCISLNDIKALVVTHEHNDHAKSFQELADMGVKIVAPESLFKKYPNALYNGQIAKDKATFKITNWLFVYCFPTYHDVESYGYIFMDTQTKESVLFINDTHYFEFELNELKYDYIFIECNHIRKQLAVIMQNAINDNDNAMVKKYQRQVDYHLSLDGVKKFLKRLDLSKTKMICLMHLSKELTNDVLLKDEIFRTFNIRTIVAYKNGGMN